MKKYYAGIGSRETPESVRSTIASITAFLYEEGYILRSGGAPGADEMFEDGLKAHLYDKHPWGFWKSYQEIYVPWYCFNSSTSPLCHVSDEAIELTLKFHPAPERLTVTTRKIMGRNAYQVLGKDLKTKSDFLVCWTDSGATDDTTLRNSGGTGQAMRIAKAYDIPFFNLKDKTFDDFKRWYVDHNFDFL